MSPILWLFVARNSFCESFLSHYLVCKVFVCSATGRSVPAVVGMSTRNTSPSSPSLLTVGINAAAMYCIARKLIIYTCGDGQRYENRGSFIVQQAGLTTLVGISTKTSRKHTGFPQINRHLPVFAAFNVDLLEKQTKYILFIFCPDICYKTVRKQADLNPLPSTREGVNWQRSSSFLSTA